ncbi:MAG: hypothetical protein LBM97_01580 [Candidatus Nomurabacteria bacterium]|jgi:hypothetical protein|nr:hypothetical protein [Candidatus Nomurabacteria bacterium]
MGKITVNDIDFEELDAVVADILAPEEELNEDDFAAEGSSATVIITDVENDATMDEELIMEEVEEVKPMKINQDSRSRKMRTRSESEKMQLNKIRTEKRFGRNLKPISDLKDGFFAREKTVAKTAPIEPKEVILPKIDLLSENPEMKIINDIVSRQEVTARKIATEEQKEILTQVAQTISEGRKPVKADKLADVGRVVGVRKPTIRKPISARVVVAKPNLPKVTMKKADTAPRKIAIVPKKAVAKIAPTVKKTEWIGEFAGDEFSEKVAERLPLQRAKMPFIAGVKVAKKPLGGGSVEVVKTKNVEVLRPVVKPVLAKLDFERGAAEKTDVGKTALVAKKPETKKIKVKKAKKDRVKISKGALVVMIVVVLAIIVVGLAVGVALYYFMNK